MNPDTLWDFQIRIVYFFNACSRENVQNKAVLFSRVKTEPSIQIPKNGEHVEEHVDKYSAGTKDQIPYKNCCSGQLARISTVKEWCLAIDGLILYL